MTSRTLAVLERGLAAGSLLAGGHLVATLLTGGYTLRLGLVRVSGKSAISAVLAGSLLASAWIGVRSLRTGIGPARRAGIVFFLGLAAFLLNRNLAVSGDVIPATYLPLAVVRHGSLDLNGFPNLYENGLVHSMTSYQGRVLSSYPVGAPLAVLPFYIPAGLSAGQSSAFLVHETGKIAAAVVAMTSVIFLYHLLLRISAPGPAGLVSAIYAFGTSTLSSSSQMLWQHGPAQFFIVLGLWVLLNAESHPKRAALAGIPLALSVICRPTNVIVFGVFWLYAVVRHGRPGIWFVAGLLPAGLILAFYNIAYYGSAAASAGGYNWGMTYGFTTPLWDGLAGILVSPGHGLLVYSPVLVFALAGVLARWRYRGIAVASVLAFVGAALIHAKWDGWWGGVCFGPRLLSDSLPLLALLLVPAAERVWNGPTLLKWGVGILTAVSVWIHAMGASLPNRWDGAHLIHGTLQADARELWKVVDSPLVTYLSDLFTPLPEAGAFVGTILLAAGCFFVLLMRTKQNASNGPSQTPVRA